MINQHQVQETPLGRSSEIRVIPESLSHLKQGGNSLESFNQCRQLPLVANRETTVAFNLGGELFTWVGHAPLQLLEGFSR